MLAFDGTMIFGVTRQRLSTRPCIQSFEFKDKKDKKEHYETIDEFIKKETGMSTLKEIEKKTF